MRKVTRDKSQEQVAITSQAPIEERDFSERPFGAAAVVADARRRRTDGQEVPKAQHFRVVKGGSFRDPGGYRAKLNMGKEISSINYDIRELRKQGIVLEPIDEQELHIPGNDETMAEVEAALRNT